MWRLATTLKKQGVSRKAKRVGKLNSRKNEKSIFYVFSLGDFDKFIFVS